MNGAVEFRGVTKRYGATPALDDVDLVVPCRSITGLVGRNGSGKTTLMRHVTGMVLPDAGECVTLGRAAQELGREELSRIGVVHQEDTLLPWMRAGQLLRYVASFYERWDGDLERSLVDRLEVDLEAKVGAMSPGTRQKLALVMATCHHPDLLLLDEPLSDLDPMARQTLLSMLLDRFSSDDMAIVISSHMLRDIEPVVDRIVCLDRGRVTANDALDDLKERYVEWIVTSTEGRLPASFEEAYVISATGDVRRVRLVVDDRGAQAESFAARYGVTVEARPLNLEALFPMLVSAGERIGGGPFRERRPAAGARS